MERQLLIIGAGIYSAVAAEIAENLGCYTRISFVDDYKTIAANGDAVVGKTSEIKNLEDKYSDAIVAIGDPEVRLALLERIKNCSSLRIATLVSPKAFVSRYAQVAEGCIVEPMAVVQARCRIMAGCIISAGAVVNHSATCCEGVHVDCNATVEGYAVVAPHTKVYSGQVYREVNYRMNRNCKGCEGMEYSFDDGM